MSLVIHVLRRGLFVNLSLLHTESHVYDDIMGELSKLNAQLRHTPFGVLEMLEMLSYYFFPFGGAFTYSSPGLQA
jgi:hypothetical protein